MFNSAYLLNESQSAQLFLKYTCKNTSQTMARCFDIDDQLITESETHRAEELVFF